MSRSTTLGFKFDQMPDFIEIVAAVRTKGGVFAIDEKLFFVENSNGMYDWIFGDPIDESSILALLAEKSAASVEVGIRVAWPDANRGGTVLVYPSLNQISFMPDAGSPAVPSAPEFTSLGWFLDRLTADFAPLGLQSVTASDIP
ncbi:hypothetical protein [Kutzneria sp. NPDC052558]|uniref:hypothetical protein n=1 Tax=Kutzneria sp. NPDC052558 TaxID=3364121 RepID=UPI0037C94C49